jgi:hypothetical protein
LESSLKTIAVEEIKYFGGLGDEGGASACFRSRPIWDETGARRAAYTEYRAHKPQASCLGYGLGSRIHAARL